MDSPHEHLLNWHKFSCRYHLKPSDAQFIKHILKSEHYSASDWSLLEDDIDFKNEILDNEELIKTILNHPNTLPISLELYFYVTLRNVFVKNNLPSRKLADYIVSILVQKTKTPFSNFYITDELQLIQQQKSAENRFFMRVHLANHTLFLTSLFDDHFHLRTQKKGAPNLQFYQNIAQTQYVKAFEHPLSDEFRLKEVFATLGNHFEKVRLAINDFKSFYPPYLT